MNNDWTTPHPSNLTFNNCSLAARWATVAWHSEDVGQGLTVSMVRNGLSTYFRAANISDPGDIELMRWAMFWGNDSASAYLQASKVGKGYQHVANSSNPVTDSMWNYVHEKCMEGGMSAHGVARRSGCRRCWRKNLVNEAR
jgi:hypothetical protein